MRHDDSGCDDGSQTSGFCDSIAVMAKAVESLPDDVETLKAMVIAARAERLAAKSKPATPKPRTMRWRSKSRR